MSHQAEWHTLCNYVLLFAYTGSRAYCVNVHNHPFSVPVEQGEEGRVEKLTREQSWH